MDDQAELMLRTKRDLFPRTGILSVPDTALVIQEPLTKEHYLPPSHKGSTQTGGQNRCAVSHLHY